METAISSRERAGKEGSSRATEALLAIESSKHAGEQGDTRTLVALSDQEARKLFSERSLARASNRGAHSNVVGDDGDSRVERGGELRGTKSSRPAPELIEEDELPEYSDNSKRGRDNGRGDDFLGLEEKYEERFFLEGKETNAEEEQEEKVQAFSQSTSAAREWEEDDELHHSALQAQTDAFDMSGLPFDPHGHPSPTFADTRHRVRHQSKKDRGRMQSKRLSQRHSTHEPEGRFRIRGHSP